ncbi:MAG TPA: ATP synthase F1 subunit delta [Leptospiraceae bacterium]|nr:ATP synthase F1 subunit delta [Leptospiraceae bacterium]HMW04933.1 ATP synthase F1 subunit delta [Leptospiraceae bacterium]HMX31918.1 ATP synthase F1 subunit delta [Leptospiraceae bacterium]HMY30846.1 ATP synthase F1 subunit delta [Leptospiraceae bacterium]HMZ62650.1 ATP synthase F1 subunit delta [Leptospiraceae bacterium]
MDNIHVGKVYAEALLEIAAEKKNSVAIEEELQAAVKAICDDKQVWEFFLSPKISKEQKIKVIESSFKNSLSETVNSLLYLLLRKDRIFFIREIAHQFSLGNDRLNGRIRAYVESASKLSDSQVSEIRSALSQKYNGECIIENVIKPELIGGMVIRFNDNLIDGSMKSQLTNIKKNLLQSKLGGAYYEN